MVDRQKIPSLMLAAVWFRAMEKLLMKSFKLIMHAL